MTAGRGIVHSERSDAEIRKNAQTLYGLQSWVALPQRDEETRACLRPLQRHRPARRRCRWHAA